MTTRRGFLKAVTGLAAYAAVQNAIGDWRIAPETFRAVERVVDNRPVTVVEGQTFFLDKPYVIDQPNTLIMNCRFYVRGDGPAIICNADNCTIMGCFVQVGWPKVMRDGKPYNTLAEAVEGASPGSTSSQVLPCARRS